MRIVEATITYPPSLGGLDRYVKETSEGLIKRGHEVTVVTTDLEQPYSRRRLAIPIDYRDLARVRRLRTVRIPRLGFPIPWEAGSIIRKTRPEVIHAHCALHSPAPIAWRTAQKLRVPFVLNTVFSPRRGSFWRFYRRLIGAMIRNAACVIAISDFERQLLVQEGVARDRVTVLFPGVDLSGFKAPRTSIFARWGLQSNRVIVSLGRLAFGKRVDRLIQAMPALLRRAPDLRLFIIGPDYGDEQRLRSIVSGLGLNSQVTFAGPLPAEDVAAALQWSFAFVMTSDFELFGITLIEAMAAGAPVIAPDVASVPNVVRNGQTGLLYRYDDVDDLGVKIGTLLEQETLRTALVEAAKVDVRDRFDFEKNLDALENIYRSAVTKRASRA